MKQILLLTGLCAVFCSRMDAQEVSFRVGQSANHDPITRHHEAFMDAFIKSIQVRDTEDANKLTLSYTDADNKLVSESCYTGKCQIETVSSVTTDGRESVTISIGSDALDEYECRIKTITSDDVTETTTKLNIWHKSVSDSTFIEARHTYTKTCYTYNGYYTQSQIKYDCEYISQHE